MFTLLEVLAIKVFKKTFISPQRSNEFRISFVKFEFRFKIRRWFSYLSFHISTVAGLDLRMLILAETAISFPTVHGDEHANLDDTALSILYCSNNNNKDRRQTMKFTPKMQNRNFDGILLFAWCRAVPPDRYRNVPKFEMTSKDCI